MSSNFCPLQTEVVGDLGAVHVVDSSNPTSSSWCEDGPFDTCCYCFPLRIGVGILAVLDLIPFGIWLNVAVIRKADEPFEFLLDNAKDMYAFECEGAAEPGEGCADLAENVGEFQEIADEMSVPLSLYVRVALSMIAGAIGLWAVFGSNATVARIYLYTWPLRYVGAVLFVLISHGAVIKDTPALQLIEALRLAYFLYYVKVVWAYQKMLQRRTESTGLAVTTHDAAGDLELNNYSVGDTSACRSVVKGVADRTFGIGNENGSMSRSVCRA